MGKYKVPLHATVDSDVIEKINEIRMNKAAQNRKILSKSKVVEELLRIGIEEYEKRQKKSKT